MNSLFSLVFVYQVKLLGEVSKPLRVITKNQSDMKRYLPESDTSGLGPATACSRRAKPSWIGFLT